MEKIFTKALGLVLVSAMLLSVIPPMFATEPPVADAIWLEPSAGISLTTTDPSHQVGYLFTIKAWAKSSVACGAWSIRLAWRTSILDCISASYTSAPEYFFYNISTVPVAPSFAALNVTHRRVDFGASWAGVGPFRDPGSGSLAEFTFNVTSAPVKGGNILDSFDIHSFDPAHSGSPKTYLIDAVTSANYGIGVDTGYSFVWGTPGAAFLVSEPDQFWAASNINHTGETFTETITLNVSPNWYLTNASFRMNFDATFLKINTVTLAPVWNADSSYVINNPLGRLDVVVFTTSSVGPAQLVATVVFEITFMPEFPNVKSCYLTFSNRVFWDHVQQTTYGTDQTAHIVLEGLRVYELPDLAVIPPVSYFELPPVGTVFSVDIMILNLHSGWGLVGYEFRLAYDDEWLEIIDVDEGPYLPAYAPYGTWYTVIDEVSPLRHILVGELILPNGSGIWNPPFPGDDPETGPNGDGVVTTVTFRTIKAQSGPGVITLPLNLFAAKWITYKGDLYSFRSEQDGTVVFNDHITTGYVIDVYGGADNHGYGPCPEPWEAPYGGQGPNMPMDLVVPQSCVCLYANLWYNGWPVQQKDINFEVEGPYDHIDGQYIPRQNHFILTKESARTNSTGQVSIWYRMPWPCDDPESLLGVWKVTVTSVIGDTIVMDTLYYYYDYMVHIWKVTTDKYFYKHCEDVVITVEYGSHSMQTYPALFAIVIKDDLGVPFGPALIETEVGGAVFCTYENGTVVGRIHVMKWWFVGYGDIYVNCFDKDPTDGGFNWYKQVFVDNAIYILPEWA